MVATSARTVLNKGPVQVVGDGRVAQGAVCATWVNALRCGNEFAVPVSNQGERVWAGWSRP
jgi:hypothetical protein